jgi:hypothetical protein
MTDPLQPYDVELLKKYDAELQKLETLPPAEIELPANQALALVTHIQIAAANPAVKHNPLLPSAIAAAKQIQSSIPTAPFTRCWSSAGMSRKREAKMYLTKFLLASPEGKKS